MAIGQVEHDTLERSWVSINAERLLLSRILALYFFFFVVACNIEKVSQLTMMNSILEKVKSLVDQKGIPKLYPKVFLMK